MRWPRRDTLIPLALGALAFVVALLQRPGLEVADTKVDLHVDPARFLRDVLARGRRATSLGHVFAGQYGGYAWPMAPFFALGDALGAADVGRRSGCGSGTLLALAAWGMVRLLDALVGRPRGVAHVAAGVLYIVNPYVVGLRGPHERSRCSPTRRCRGCCSACTAGCATRAAGGGRRRSRSC